MKVYKENKLRYFRWHWGDRYDAWRVRKVDPVFSVIPYFLRTRMDAQNYFEERIPIDNIEAFIREHKEEIPGLSLMHVVIAALVRLISQRPNLNRFVMWNKIFARNYLNISIAVKRTLSDEGEETLIKPYFLPTDTLYDVVKKIKKEQEENQQVGQQNTSDMISKILGVLPDFMMRIVVFSLLWMDKVGLLPRFIEQASPWHCSFFLTNIGSIGVESIYHHLYEFGNCSIFVALGKKSQRHTVSRSGDVKPYKSILLKFVLDERICDGYYYASSMRTLAKIFQNPEQLLTPPEKVLVDEGVKWKRIDI
ncbi:MAG TPA: 2-oxo acid dehydrogenase subunit E2 [Paludibacteraceae bacterium]|nr:2-oxo acid dehydrogenase subunit E2 [Paludibacteraceae bacterium]